MTAHLSKARAPLWGALLAPLFYPTAGICPGTRSPGENESAARLLVVVVVVVMVGCVCVCVCVRALRWEGGAGESQPASFFQDMGKKGGGIAPLIPAQSGQDPVGVGRSCNPDQPLGNSPCPGGRTGREQVLYFSRQAVSMNHSPWGPEELLPACSLSHTPTPVTPPAHAHSLQLLLHRLGTRDSLALRGPRGLTSVP